MLSLLVTTLSADRPESAGEQESEICLRPGTEAPERDGVYQLACGSYARFLNGHWRLKSESLERAAEEERLAPFAVPVFRRKDEHRWCLPAGVPIGQGGKPTVRAG